MDTSFTAPQFVHSGAIFITTEPSVISTVLGTCIAVCLWDKHLKHAGMNHYVLPIWDGSGLPSPRFGNIAISKLIQEMEKVGSRKHNLIAKVFGGKEVGQDRESILNIGWRNAVLAVSELREAGIDILAIDVGGNFGRKILFNSENGVISLRRFR